MVDVTITDEGTRRALLFAVWERAASEIGEAFYDALHIEARETLVEQTGPSQIPWFRSVADEVELLRSTFDAAGALQTAALGDEITIDMPAAAMTNGLSGCVASLAENESFWLLPRDERERALDTFDAAQKLLRQVNSTVEVVA